MDWNKMVKMTVPVGLCGWQQRGSLTINGRTTEFPVGVETELPEPVAERIKALIADAEEKAEHVQPLQPWMQHVTGADGVARWEPRIDKPGDPHQYLTTDGDGKPHWEDKLAYEASTEEVILPDTVVTDAMYKQTWVPCPNASNVKIGDTGTFYIDGKACPFEAVAGTNNYGPPADVKLYVKNHGLITQPGYMIGFVGDRLMIYNVWLTDPGQSKTISITKNSTTIKTLDPKFLPGSSAGAGGGVIYIDTEITAPYTEVVAYADAACTTPLTYEQGKAIVGTGCALSHKAENGQTLTFVPAFTHAFDANKQVMCFVSVLNESMMFVTTTVDVGFAGE